MPTLTTHADIGRLERGRLLLLLLGVLPLLAYVMIGAEATRHATLDWLDAELRDAARQAAAREAEELGRAAQLLDTIAETPLAAETLCAALRPRLAGGPADVAALAVHFADAQPACAAAVQPGRAIGSQHVRAALAANGAVALSADPGVGLVVSRSLLVADGAAAVLALALAPSHLPPLALPLRRDHVSRLLVDPADGVVLAAQPADAGAGEPTREAGGTLDVPRALAALRAGIPDGVTIARDAAGIRRLTGHAELVFPAGIAGRAALLVELPYDELLAEADARRRDQRLAALAMVLMGIALAGMLTRSLFLPPGGPQASERALAALRPAGAWLRHQADMAAVTNAACEMFLRLDADLRVLYASPATRQVLGYAPTEVEDADLAAEPGWEPCQAQLDALRRGEATVAPIRILARRRDDTRVQLQVRASRLGDGGFMLACRDIGVEQALEARLGEAQARLAALALLDAQSGLANRRRFDDALEEEVRRARRAQEPVSLVLVHLADWSGYGARHGEAVADDAVQRVARILSAMLRWPGDLAARLEEDVFAVLLPTSDRIGVQRMAERLQDSLATAWSETPDAALSSRIGACSVLPLADGDGPEMVLDLARQALGEADGDQRGVVLLNPAAPDMPAAQREFLAS